MTAPSVLLLSVAVPGAVLLRGVLPAADSATQSSAGVARDFRFSSFVAPVLPARLANLAPAVIFADANILSYRSDLSEPAPTELSAAFHGRRESPLGEMVASSDACPAVDGSTGAADRESTITLFFTADSGATHVTGEFTLWRQVNDSSPVAMVRHVLRDGRLPFLEYRYVVPTDGGVDSLATVPRGLLPISRRDTVSSVVDVRALRAVEWHFLVPLDSATRPRIARVHLVTSLPAVSQLDRHECRETSHDPPLLAGRDRDGAGTGASQPPPGRLRAVA